MALKYVGAGIGYIHGVPARDLTDEEEAQHGATIAEQERASGLHLYEKEQAKAQRGKAEPEKENG